MFDVTELGVDCLTGLPFSLKLEKLGFTGGLCYCQPEIFIGGMRGALPISLPLEVTLIACRWRTLIPNNSQDYKAGQTGTPVFTWFK